MRKKMLNILFIILILTVASGNLHCQVLPDPVKEYYLYKGAAPGSENWDWSEKIIVTESGLPVVQNVVKPVLQYYPAGSKNSTGTAMIIAPGGGFRNLMMSYEGVDIALRLNEMGVDAFVLKYRLGYTGAGNKKIKEDIRELAACDGKEAVKLVRSMADELNILPNRIGMMGFSAGGYVTVATVIGAPETRPDFAAPIYAAICADYELPAVVPEDAPPLFIATAADDQIIPWKCAVDLFSSWINAGYQAELHIFQTGKHGFVKKGGGADHFMDRLEEWMKVNGWIGSQDN